MLPLVHPFTQRGLSESMQQEPSTCYIPRGNSHEHWSTIGSDFCTLLSWDDPGIFGFEAPSCFCTLSSINVWFLCGGCVAVRDARRDEQEQYAQGKLFLIQTLKD